MIQTMEQTAQTIELYQDDFLCHQWEFLNAWNKTLGLVGGLGSGKTVPFLYKTFICHTTRPGANGLSRIGILYPTYKMNKSLFFEPFLMILRDAQIAFDKSTTTLEIETEFGRIINFSMQNPERIIGETLTDAGADEIDTVPMPKGLEVVRKLRERLRGRRDSQFYLVSSPEGFSTCYNILKENPNPNTKLIHAKTTDNIYLPQEYIDDILATYDETMALAYINGQFVNLNSKQAHYSFKRDIHVHDFPLPTKTEVARIGVDFNVDPLCACVCYTKEIDGVQHYFFYDEYFIRNSNTYALADLLEADYTKTPVICYPDPTGDSRKTSADISDVQILQRKGFEIHFKHGITQRYSLNITNGAFAHNRIHILPKCKHLIADLEQVVTDEYGQIMKPKGTMLTHISDAMRNVIVIDTLMRSAQKGKEL